MWGPAQRQRTTGDFQGTTTWGVILTSSGGPDVFLAKYNTSGTLQWAFGYGSVNTDQGHGVDVDAAGNILAMWYFAGTADLGTGPLASAGGSDIFIARYDATGAAVWARRLGGANTDQITTVEDVGNDQGRQLQVRFMRSARVATLVASEIREAGAYRTEWNGRSQTGIDVPAGMYFARIEHAAASRTRKLALIK